MKSYHLPCLMRSTVPFLQIYRPWFYHISFQISCSTEIHVEVQILTHCRASTDTCLLVTDKENMHSTCCYKSAGMQGVPPLPDSGFDCEPSGGKGKVLGRESGVLGLNPNSNDNDPSACGPVTFFLPTVVSSVLGEVCTLLPLDSFF